MKGWEKLSVSLAVAGDPGQCSGPATGTLDDSTLYLRDLREHVIHRTLIPASHPQLYLSPNGRTGLTFRRMVVTVFLQG